MPELKNVEETINTAADIESEDIVSIEEKDVTTETLAAREYEDNVEEKEEVEKIESREIGSKSSDANIVDTGKILSLSFYIFQPKSYLF